MKKNKLSLLALLPALALSACGGRWGGYFTEGKWESEQFSYAGITFNSFVVELVSTEIETPISSDIVNDEGRHTGNIYYDVNAYIDNSLIEQTRELEGMIYNSNKIFRVSFSYLETDFWLSGYLKEKKGSDYLHATLDAYVIEGTYSLVSHPYRTIEFTLNPVA